MPNISTSDAVKENLERIRDRDQHTSVDSVIRMLLIKSGEDDDGGIRNESNTQGVKK